MGGDGFAEGDGVVDGSGGFGPADAVEEGDGAEPEMVLDDLGAGGDGALATAAHGAEEGAFGGDGLVCVVVVEACADGLEAFVVGADFDADGALADAGQHEVEGEDGGEESVRDGVADESALGGDLEVESGQAGQCEDGGVEGVAGGEFFEACGDVAAQFGELEVGSEGLDLGLTSGATGGDDGAGREVEE